MDRFRLMPNYRYYNIEGTSPLTLDKSVGKPLRDYKIYGNSVQDGTPAPDAPVEIQSIGDKTKNLFNEELLLEHSAVEKTKDGYVVSIYPAIYTANTELVSHIKSVLKAGVTYTLSRKVSNYASSSSGLIAIRDSSAALVTVTLGDGVKSTTFTLTQEQIDSIDKIYVYGHPETPTLFEYIQLEEGETATEYEPYYDGYRIPITVNEDIYHIYLDEPLRKIGTYADYIDFINHKVIRKNKRTTIYLTKLTAYNTISENLKTYVASGMFTDCNNANAYNVTHKCNKFKYNNGGNLKPAESVGEWLAMRGNGTVYITIKTERLSEATVKAAKDYVNGLNAEVVYQLAEPIEEDISLPTIKTHKGTNIITVGTTVPASNITTQHYKYKGD